MKWAMCAAPTDHVAVAAPPVVAQRLRVECRRPEGVAERADMGSDLLRIESRDRLHGFGLARADLVDLIGRQVKVRGELGHVVALVGVGLCHTDQCASSLSTSAARWGGVRTACSWFSASARHRGPMAATLVSWATAAST